MLSDSEIVSRSQKRRLVLSIVSSFPSCDHRDTTKDNRSWNVVSTATGIFAAARFGGHCHRMSRDAELGPGTAKSD
jgi:hypothetical protein